MNCDDARDIVSAHFDGEATAHEAAALTAHLSTCLGCQAYNARVTRLQRDIRVRPAVAVPDLVASVTARARPARLGRGGWLRPALAWVAVVILVQSVPALVLGDATGADTHLARHLGAFSAALAVGFAYAAWRPHRAFGMLPFVGALVATTLASAVLDVANGGRSAITESVHLVEMIGLLLLWMIAGSPGWPARLHPPIWRGE